MPTNADTVVDADTVDLAFAGSGWIAAVHGYAVRHVPGLRISKVASRDPAKAAIVAKRVKAEACTYAELPAAADGVVVCTPPAQHLEHAQLAIAGDAGVLIEKPLCTTLAEADVLVAAENDGARIAYAENLLHAPILRLAVAHAAQLHAIDLVEVRALQSRPTWGDFLTEGWGGGVLFDLGVHPLAVALVLAAPAIPVEVCARLEGAEDHPVDEHAEVTIHFDTGLLARVKASWRGADTPTWDAQVSAPDGVVRMELLPALVLERNGVEVPLPGIPGGRAGSARGARLPPPDGGLCAGSAAAPSPRARCGLRTLDPRRRVRGVRLGGPGQRVGGPPVRGPPRPHPAPALARMSDPTSVATAWMDRAWDDAVGLLWNPPGAFSEVAEPRSVHLVRETAWYALGLLRRSGPGDHERAERALHAVIDHQYEAPGEAWHGTFVRFPEWAAPKPGAVEWVDYDPNWRQFVGTALAVAVSDFTLSPALDERARVAVALAVAAEPPDRVPPTYANIALLRAWLEAWVGGTDTRYPAAIAEAFRRHDCFTEHNSPTYYGIDLLALGLWQRPDARADLRAHGAEIEAALWTDVARWWHAGLGNLCGPYSRAYGMDLRSYLSGLSLALWCADLPAPLPDLTAERIPHGHDLCLAPLLQHVGVRVPAAARPAFERFPGAHGVEQLIDDDPRRIATAWLDDGVMIGAEAHAGGPQARGQYHPATIHWRLPDGTVGWLRLVHHGPTRATASERRLEIECLAPPRRGPQPLRWESNTPATEVRPDHWSFPGLDLAVTTDAGPLDVITMTQAPAPAAMTRITLTIA